MNNKKTRVLIIGGGFAGVRTARKLYKNPNIEVTIATNEDTFRYGATIWRATAGYLKSTSYMPISSLVPVAPNVRLVYDTATNIDKKKRNVTFASGNIISYDYCVIGLGVVTSYFGIKGLAEYSHTIKSSQGFDKFRDHIHQELIDEKALDKNYVIVGAGPTGVELAAVLKDYLAKIAKNHKLRSKKVNMELIEASPRVLPMLSEKASRLTLERLKQLGVNVKTSTSVKGETKNTINIDGKSVPSRTVVWTAGVTSNPFFTENEGQFELNERRRVIVDENLKVDKRTFVIGDSAATKYSGLALTALHNGSYVAKCINRTISGRSVKPYKPLKPITVVPVGEDWAILEWRGLILSGKLASFIRTIYDFIGYSEVMGVRAAYAIWKKRNHKHEDCPKCKSIKSK